MPRRLAHWLPLEAVRADAGGIQERESSTAFFRKFATKKQNLGSTPPKAPAPMSAILATPSGSAQLPVLALCEAYTLHVSSLTRVSFTPVPGCSQLTFTPPIFGSTCACRCEQFGVGCEYQSSDALGLFFGSWRWCQHREAFRSVEGGARGVPRRRCPHAKTPKSPKIVN